MIFPVEARNKFGAYQKKKSLRKDRDVGVTMLYAAPGRWMRLWMTSSLTGRDPISSLNAAVEQDAENADCILLP